MIGREADRDGGSAMACETRYDVNPEVDSPCPADKFPAMCGSATFAIDVSSTSMNVASVTVMAITQGLIVPSGIRSLDKILSRIASDLCPCCFYVLPFESLSVFPLICDHRRV